MLSNKYLPAIAGFIGVVLGLTLLAFSRNQDYDWSNLDAATIQAATGTVVTPPKVDQQTSRNMVSFDHESKSARKGDGPLYLMGSPTEVQDAKDHFYDPFWIFAEAMATEDQLDEKDEDGRAIAARIYKTYDEVNAEVGKPRSSLERTRELRLQMEADLQLLKARVPQAPR